MTGHWKNKPSFIIIRFSRCKLPLSTCYKHLKVLIFNLSTFLWSHNKVNLLVWSMGHTLKQKGGVNCISHCKYRIKTSYSLLKVNHTSDFLHIINLYKLDDVSCILSYMACSLLVISACGRSSCISICIEFLYITVYPVYFWWTCSFFTALGHNK